MQCRAVGARIQALSIDEALVQELFHIGSVTADARVVQLLQHVACMGRGGACLCVLTAHADMHGCVLTHGSHEEALVAL